MAKIKNNNGKINSLTTELAGMEHVTLTHAPTR